MKISKLFLAIGISLLIGGLSEASIKLDDWSIDLGGTTGTNTSVFEGVDKVGFNGSILQVEITDVDGSGGASVLDTAVIRGVILMSTLLDTNGTYTGGAGGGIIPTPGLNTSWEITAKFEANILFSGISGAGTLEFVHTGGANTFMDLYIDQFGSGGTGSQANNLTGAGYDDGDLIASFVDSVTGFVNPFSVTALDGSDDAIFNYVAGSGVGGVLFTLDGADDGSADGIDLITGTVPALLSDIDTDENFDRNNLPAWAGTSPSLWGTTFSGATIPGSSSDPLNFFVDGDGSAVLDIIPEPISFLCWAGLFVMAGPIRRRNRAIASC